MCSSDLATSVLLVSFNWPENSERYRRTAEFVNALFSKIGEFQKPPRHPKWSEASLNIKVPGWERFKAADDWLASHAVASQPKPEAFGHFLSQNRAEPGSPEDKAELMRQFMEWRKTRAPASR